VPEKWFPAICGIYRKTHKMGNALNERWAQWRNRFHGQNQNGGASQAICTHNSLGTWQQLWLWLHIGHRCFSWQYKSHLCKVKNWTKKLKSIQEICSSQIMNFAPQWKVLCISVTIRQVIKILLSQNRLMWARLVTSATEIHSKTVLNQHILVTVITLISTLRPQERSSMNQPPPHIHWAITLLLPA
jgi:hypothetical protein